MKDKSFTIKVPVELLDQIEARRYLARRSRNKEVINLIEIALNFLSQDALDSRAMARKALGHTQTVEEQT